MAFTEEEKRDWQANRKSGRDRDAQPQTSAAPTVAPLLDSVR